jgi:hypothetical protein
VFFIGTGVAATAAVALFVFAPTQSAGTLRATPYVARDGAGLSVGGDLR